MEKPGASTTEAATPIRGALIEGSSLSSLVLDGLGAVESAHRNYLDEKIRPLFADSLELDKAMEREHPNDHRWDYLLGHAPSGRVIAVEPHSARSDQVTTVIAKRAQALTHLRGHLRKDSKVAEWIWVASGRVDFSPFDRVKRRLDSAGIRFVGAQVKAKDLARLGDAAEKK